MPRRHPIFVLTVAALIGLCFGATPSAAQPLPDVIVTSLSYASGVFTSTVKNQGTAATPAGKAIGVGYFVDGVFRTWGGSGVPPIAAGASVTIGTNGGPYTIPNGTHTMTAYVDDVNRFAESNETNNQLSQSITVGGTDTQAPTVVMTAPANGTTVSGPSVTVSANASDNVGVSGVQFKLDAANLGAEDTSSPYSISWNNPSNGSHTLTAVARDAAGNTATSAGVSVTVNNAGPSPDIIGRWSRVASLPYFPVHTHILSTGKVMIWPGDGGVSGNDPRSWDPADPFNMDPLNAGNAAHVSILSKPGYDTFCTGHSFLADGTLFVAGGHNGSNNVGLSRASTYNPFTNAWTNLPTMNAGRWYPTTTVLANGDILVVSGNTDLTIGVNRLPQVFQVATGTWRSLTSAQLSQDLYPMMLLAPNGRVFNAGPTATTRYLNTSGTGAWSSVGTRVGGQRSYGSAVMYAPGKVLVMGGGDPPKNTAEVIDLNAASPSWRAVGSMRFSRRHLNATLLPDGKVLVTGGTAAPGFNDPSGHVDAAELWDPATENWTTLSSSSGIPRVYHSTALLLPDGRVFSTGGNGHPETESYSPPYLFKGPRPTITSAPSPSSVGYGQSFFVETTDAATISRVTMLRLSSVTHAFNMSQYINELSFSPTTGGLNVTAPPAPATPGTVAPPGYYLLFILYGNGVPSVARIIKLGGTAPSDTTPPTVSITVPTSGVAVSGNAVTVSATASDNVGVAGVQFKLDGTTNLGAEDTASPYSVAWNSTTASNGSHTLTAFARDAAGNMATSLGVTVTVNNTGPPTDTQAPTVSMTAPASGATVSGSSVTVSANASDNVGVSGVQFRLDGVNLGTEDTASPYSLAWNSTTASNGSHTLTALARDAAGNTATSVGVTVTVNNTGPSPLPDVIVTSLSYASGVFTSTVKNQGTAATPAGIGIGVGYFVDGVFRTWGAVANPPLAAGQSAPVGTNGASYTIPPGTHTIKAYVDDVNRFAESDETNNQLSQPITVP